MLYFVALLPPSKLRQQIHRLKMEFKKEFKSAHALKSPPHITLLSPFSPPKPMEISPILASFVQEQTDFEVQLKDFSTFGKRVIFIDVLRNSELLLLQKNLENLARSHREIFGYNYGDREFNPHISLAFRDLTKENFDKAWTRYQNATFQSSFKASELVLFKHNRKRWEIEETFLFEAGV